MIWLLLGLLTPAYADFSSVALEEGIPARLLRGVCWVESSHNPFAHVERDGNSPSYGICQVKLATARMLGFTGSAQELRLPQVNMRYAAKYIRKQLKRYDGDWVKAIIAYNRGRYKLDHKSTEYLRRVLNAMKERR